MRAAWTRTRVVMLGGTLGLALAAGGFAAGWRLHRPVPPAADARGAVLFWRNPMDPGVTSPVPAKDSMGMDYLPVYAGDAGGAGPAPAGVAVPPETRQSLGVRTAPVRTALLERRWQATGVLGWDESRIVHLHTRVPGWVRHLHAHALGEPVRAGQVLATLDSNALDAAQREHLVALHAGDAALAAASRQRLAALGMSAAQVGALERSGRSSREVAVHAPTDGVITELGARHGMYVTLDTELFALAPFDRLWVEAQLPPREADAVRVGDAVRVVLAQQDTPALRARVDYVYPQLDPATRATRVRLGVDNPDGTLRAGMWVRVEGRADADVPVLAVPDDALIGTGDGEHVVLALPDGRFDVRAVRTGRHAGGLTEIRAGLEAGQQVVTAAQFLLDAEADVQASLAALQAPAGQAPVTSGPGAPAASGQTDHTGQAGHPGLSRQGSGAGHAGHGSPGGDANHTGHAGLGRPADHAGHPSPGGEVGHAGHADPAMAGHAAAAGHPDHAAPPAHPAQPDQPDHPPHADHAGHANPAAPADPPRAAGDAAADDAPGIPVSAVVRGVDAATGTLTLAHPAIEALGMPAMTMPFGIGAGVDVTGLRVGDAVRVRVVASARGCDVIALERTGPAP